VRIAEAGSTRASGLPVRLLLVPSSLPAASASAETPRATSTASEKESRERRIVIVMWIVL
jgi:hypothetical protein